MLIWHQFKHNLFYNTSENMCYTFFTEKNANESSLTTEEPSGRSYLHCKHAYLLGALSLYRATAASQLLKQQLHQHTEGPQGSSPGVIFVASFILKPREDADWHQSLCHHTVFLSECLGSYFHYDPQDEQSQWPFWPFVASALSC